MTTKPKQKHGQEPTISRATSDLATTATLNPSSSMASPNLSQVRLSAAAFGLLLLCSIVLLFEALNALVIILSSLLLVAQSFMLYKTSWLMHSVKHVNWVKNLGALAFSVLIMMNAKQLGLLNAMVNLLFSGALLWLVTADLNSPKWARQVFAVQAILVSVSFIYQQDLHWTLMALLIVLGLFVALYWCQSAYFSNQAISSSKATSPPPKFAPMVLTCLILSALAFVVLPGLKPFWKLPDQKQNTTGLDDKMTPGDVADLAQSNRLAFRVELSGNQRLGQWLMTDHASRYWRVLTLEDFDGKTWQQHPLRKPNLRSRRFSSSESHLVPQERVRELSSLAESNPQNTVFMNIIAEPTHQPWLLSFGTALAKTPRIDLTLDTLLQANQKVTKRIKYEALMVSPNNILEPSSRAISLNRQLPAAGLNQTKALAQRLLKEATSSEPSTLSANSSEMVKHSNSTNNEDLVTVSDGTIARFNALFFQYLRNENFEYTLQPPTLSGDHLDDFLFNTKQGFCAHYASAHAVLLRSIGVPARIVTGYHGGELNPNGNYLNIYDSSAHAWVEYLDSTNRWRRIDPTSAVSPSRISDGLEASIPDEAAIGNNAINFVKQTPWLNELRQQLQSLDYYWTVWVLDFDNDKRQNTLSQFITLASLWYLGLGLLVLISLLIAVYWLKAKLQRPAMSLEVFVLVQLYKKAKALNPQGYQQWLSKPQSSTLQSPSPKLQHTTHPSTGILGNIDLSLSLSEHQALLISLMPSHEATITSVIGALNKHLYAPTSATTSTKQAALVKKQKRQFRHLIETIN